ncbi:transposase IS4 family protein [Chthoniobacter flavus Ellin428]|uniref:Transposase IS4 family protein n=1 Tax=Chthoniobacter flavus Ellin428 TaxID=497964 RepID=B4D648_9BACT|nr:IS5 family transposase [Chthoniobacter flavus]EDY17957.1 transposase IS4 family protein [Chthoniobacter flavus Ellin428]TCO81607.1 IS4 family transposase [Chthoniobacter flavus]
MAETSKDYTTHYPSDVSDAEWEFCAPYVTLMDPEAPQREYPLRALLNGLRYVAKTGVQWRYLPADFPPYHAVYQHGRRWLRAQVFESLAADLRKLLRLLQERAGAPSAVILDGRTLQSVPESGARAGYDGYKRKRGSKVHAAVDTLGHLLALTVTPANEQERAQVGELCRQVQEASGQTVQVAFVDQGYTGQAAAQQAQEHGIDLLVVKLEETKKGFVLLPRRWVVERTFAWLGRFRRLARDYERLSQTLAGFNWIAAVSLMLSGLFALLQSA